MSHAIDGKYLSITSFRRDGTGVATPVWFVNDDGRLLVETDSASYKVRRIRRNGSVRIAPCTATGRLRAGPLKAHAELLPDSELPRVDRLIRRKYRIDRVLVLPIYRAVEAVRRRGRPAGKTIVVAITPE